MTSKCSRFATPSRRSAAGMAAVSEWRTGINKAYKKARQRLTPRQTALLRRLTVGLQGEDLEDMKQILTQFAS